MSVLVMAFALLVSSPAWAQGSNIPVAPPADASNRPTSLEELARDLRSETGGIRGYAARELKRRVLRTRRTLDRGRSDSLAYIEAKVAYADQRRFVGSPAARCVRRWPAQRRTCAKILGALRDPRWAEDLRAAQAESDGKTRTIIEQALAALPAQESP